jgi:hypothetical protein
VAGRVPQLTVEHNTVRGLTVSATLPRLDAPTAIDLDLKATYARLASLPPGAGNYLASAFCLGVIALNLPYVAERIALARRHHTASHFGNTDSLRETVAHLQTQQTRQAVRAVQEHVPAGKKLLAIMLMPTALDLARNPVSGLYLAGLGVPWLRDLGQATPQQIAAYLKALGIEYLIWQRGGDYLMTSAQVKAALDIKKENQVAMDRKAVSGFLSFHKAVESFGIGPVLYYDSYYIVFSINSGFVNARVAVSYDLGAAVDFTSRGYNAYKGVGWSAPEPRGTWSDGKQAALNFRIEKNPGTDLLLTLNGSAYTTNQHPTVAVDVFASDVKIGYWTFGAGAAASRCVLIPSSLLNESNIALRLSIDSPPSPAEGAAATSRSRFPPR